MIKEKIYKSRWIIVLTCICVVILAIVFICNNGGEIKMYTISGKFTMTAVNGKTQGLYGDGVHDDTDMLNKALKDYNSVFLPKGTYLISGTIEVPDGTSLFGDGFDTVIRLSNSYILKAVPWRASYKYPYVVLGNNTILQNIMINGDETTCADQGQVGVMASGNNIIINGVKTNNVNYFPDDWIGGSSGYGTVNAPGYGIHIFNAQNVNVRDCTTNGNGYEGIGIEASQNILIENCKVGDGNRTGIQIHRYSKHVVVDDCIVNNSNTNKHADLTMHGTDDDFIDDVKIIGCSFVNACEEKASIQTVDGYEKNIIIEDCNFASNNRCISIGHDRTTGEETASKIIISGNIMKSILDGVYVRGNECIITDNIIECNGQDITVTGEDKTVANNLVK